MMLIVAQTQIITNQNRLPIKDLQENEAGCDME
jgi:hypothetical protein